MFRQWAVALAKPIHVRLRSQKVELFCEHLSDTGSTLLDVGGGIGIAGEFLGLYSHFSKVVMANLEPSLRERDGHRILQVAADGRRLPFNNKSFDWVFSNAVIEHVGNYEQQQRFADEIRRVARVGYFVTTPNRSFPLEPHTLLPFYQFLSPSWQRRMVRFSPGYLKEWEEINLLSERQMTALFPEAQVTRAGVPLFGNSLIACYKVSPQ